MKKRLSIFFGAVLGVVALAFITTQVLEADGFTSAGGDDNAATICSGTTTYLDGEGNCDDISGVYENELNNSAGLASALDDETGTLLSVFSDNPTITTGIAVPDNSISAAELDESAIFTWTGAHTFSSTATFDGLFYSPGIEDASDQKFIVLDDAEELTVTGTMHITHTVTSDDDHALEIDVTAGGFADVKAIDIDYITGALAGNEEEAVILVNVDESGATGGRLHGLEVLATTGSASVDAIAVGVGVSPIRQDVGVFGDMDSALVNGIDRLTEFTSSGSDIVMFVADNDTVTIGDAASFAEIEFLLDTPASGGGTSPTFQYTTGTGSLSSFVPVDGTNGFRNSGIIQWDVAGLSPTFAVSGSEFLIVITRTRNTLATSPIEDLVQIASTTVFGWDVNADLTVNVIQVSDGTLSLPSMSFSSDPNSGFFHTGAADEIGLTLGGGRRFDFSASGISSNDSDGPIILNEGSTATNPVYITDRGDFATGLGGAQGTVSLITGSVEAVNVDGAGIVTMALQPAFLTFTASTDANVTGNGATHTLSFITEIYDRNSDFNALTLFTAPVTGIYDCSVVVRLAQSNGTIDLSLTLVTSNRSYILVQYDDIVTAANVSINGTVTGADFDAADTATVTIQVTGVGADTADIVGGTTNSSSFSCRLAA